MEKKVVNHITKGIIIALILIVVDIIAGFTNFRYATWYKWVGVVLLVGGVIWACISYGSQMQHNVSFGSVFGHGFKASVVVTCIMVVFSVISLKFIFPETKDLMLDQMRKQMAEQGKMTEEMIDQTVEFMKKGFMTIIILSVIIYLLIAGVVSALIGAAVTKKNPVTPFDNPL